MARRCPSPRRGLQFIIESCGIGSLIGQKLVLMDRRMVLADMKVLLDVIRIIIAVAVAAGGCC